MDLEKRGKAEIEGDTEAEARTRQASDVKMRSLLEELDDLDAQYSTMQARVKKVDAAACGPADHPKVPPGTWTLQTLSLIHISEPTRLDVI
eukprot:4523314-Prorocentrum_lima.AAC.1